MPGVPTPRNQLDRVGGRTESQGRAGGPAGRAGLVDHLPPQSFFLVSAVFHYLGPSLAVLLFAWVSVLGVAWLRIVTAALMFAGWRRPWQLAPCFSGRKDTLRRPDRHNQLPERPT